MRYGSLSGYNLIFLL